MVGIQLVPGDFCSKKKPRADNELVGKAKEVQLHSVQIHELQSCYWSCYQQRTKNFSHTLLSYDKFTFSGFFVNPGKMIVIITPNGQIWYAQYLQAWQHEFNDKNYVWLRVYLWKQWLKEDYGLSLSNNCVSIDYIPLIPATGYKIIKVVDSIQTENRWIIPATFL